MTNPVNLINLVFGNFSYVRDVFMLVSIFVLNMVLEKKGFSETLQFEYEDPGSCTARICLNNDKHIIFDTNAKMIMYQNSLQNDWVVSYLKDYELSTGKPILRNYNLDLIKQRIHVRLIYDVFRKEFNRHLITYIKRTRNDHHHAMPENLTDFYWRNFSIYVNLISVFFLTFLEQKNWLQCVLAWNLESCGWYPSFIRDSPDPWQRAEFSQHHD